MGKGARLPTRHLLGKQVSSIDSQEGEHPQTPGSPAGGSSAPESCCLRNDERDLPPEAGMSGAFPPMHRRRIVIYLPTCQPEDPGTRDASVQVGVTCKDKATQWEEREEADLSPDKSSGANSTGQPVGNGGQETPSVTTCRSAPRNSRRGISSGSAIYLAALLCRDPNPVQLQPVKGGGGISGVTFEAG
ncbi:UNVERIFIED_CONTAM: hypothetical protein K2H54_005003 [Gekko kuhli]